MNNIFLAGLVSDLKFSHVQGVERFDSFTLSTERRNGVVDYILCYISENVIFEPDDNNRIAVSGEVRSRSYRDAKRKIRTETYVYVTSVEPYKGEDVNLVEFDGVICGKPFFLNAKTRDLTRLLLANNERLHPSYLNCVAWGKDAELCANLIKGHELITEGRLQSRDYTKYEDEKEVEQRRVIELSISSMCVHFS